MSGGTGGVGPCLCGEWEAHEPHDTSFGVCEGVEENSEGCPDCGSDTVQETADGDECITCGWRP